MMGAEPKYLQCTYSNRVCRLCFSYNAITSTHVLFECSSLTTARDSTWHNVLNNMPDAMAQHVGACDDENKLVFILSGLMNNYIPEWNDIYLGIVYFVNEMYSSRQKLYETI